MTPVVDATKETFRDLVAKGTVLVDVWGPACRPCLALAPTVDTLAETYEHLSVVKLEAPTARRLCMELQVMSLPAFLMFADGEEVARLSDPALSASKLTDWVSETLNATPPATTSAATSAATSLVNKEEEVSK